MVTKKRGLVVKVEQPSFPADPFKVKLNSLLLSVSNRKKDHEAEWGIGRLIELVDSELRTKFWNQMERVWTAQENRDEERLEKAVKGMIAGYYALEGYAIKNGISRMPDIAAIEHEMADGSVMVIVKTKADALLYSQFRPEVQGQHIWNMGEIETMMAGAVMQQNADQLRMQADEYAAPELKEEVGRAEAEGKAMAAPAASSAEWNKDRKALKAKQSQRSKQYEINDYK